MNQYPGYGLWLAAIARQNTASEVLAMLVGIAVLVLIYSKWGGERIQAIARWGVAISFYLGIAVLWTSR